MGQQPAEVLHQRRVQVQAAQLGQPTFAYDLAGLLNTYGEINIGEGFRPNILDPRKGNIDYDPLLINGYIPSHFSPVIDKGNAGRLTNSVIFPVTDADARKAGFRDVEDFRRWLVTMKQGPLFHRIEVSYIGAPPTD